MVVFIFSFKIKIFHLKKMTNFFQNTAVNVCRRLGIFAPIWFFFHYLFCCWPCADGGNSCIFWTIEVPCVWTRGVERNGGEFLPWYLILRRRYFSLCIKHTMTFPCLRAWEPQITFKSPQSIQVGITIPSSPFPWILPHQGSRITPSVTFLPFRFPRNWSFSLSYFTYCKF